MLSMRPTPSSLYVQKDSQKDHLVNKHLGNIKLKWGFPFDDDYQGGGADTQADRRAL